MAPLSSGGREARGPAPDGVVEAVVRALTLPGGSPGALAAAARERGGVGEGARGLLAARVPRLAGAALDRWRGWSARALEVVAGGVRVLVRGYDGYPGALLDLDDPPPALFLRGDLSLLDRPAVAVVGTRRCTAEGERAAGRIAGGLASGGVVVVSGLALGIDGAAHRGAGARNTIAVLGCGVDVPYPPRHDRLHEAIGREGLLVSERPPGTPPFAFLFPERNRIIAALSRAVVVVEAPEPSGALITADRAFLLNRPVFAVPGPLGRREYEGSNARIRDRVARLVTGAGEVLKELGLDVPADFDDLPPPDLEGVGLALWRAVGRDARHADALADAVGLDTAQGLASLLALELQGHLTQLPGMRFARTRTAAAGAG